jgi:hypothetical protein
MQHFVDYLDRAGPVLGLRTATHGFNKIPKGHKWGKYDNGFSGTDYKGGWGRHVLGEKWAGHYGGNHKTSTRINVVPEKKDHPILRGVGKTMWVQCGGYKADPLKPFEVLAMAQPIAAMRPDAPAIASMPPVPAAWTRSYNGKDGKKSRVFTSTYGTSNDLESTDFRRMLINACFWAVGLEGKIATDMNVEFVGPYHATWRHGRGQRKSGTRPADLAGWDSPIMPLQK